MTLADKIREFANENYIELARKRGEREVSIRAGDIHRDMELHGRLPAVCAALGSNKFLDEAGVERVAVDGPLNGSNCVLTFQIK